MNLDLSVVVPVYNEAPNLPELHARIQKAVSPLGIRYEILYVDDGSSDESVSILEQIAHEDPTTKVVCFRRNFGQTAALSAGFDHAQGEVIITMDGDLQNDPADIPGLLARLDEGYDLVSGWRAKRQDGFLLRRFPSILANRLIGRLTGVRLHDFGCTLKAYRRVIAKDIRLYGEMHRFIPAYAKLVGARITEMEVLHHPRTQGQSKYGISRTPRVVLDLITIKFLMSYSTRPIQIFGGTGLVSGLLGFIICAYLSIGKIFFPSPGTSLNERMPMLVLGVFLMFIGIQFITMGLLGEIIVRTYHESQNKPTYVVRRIIGNTMET